MFYRYLVSCQERTDDTNTDNLICTRECFRKMINGKLQCNCGVIERGLEWSWTKTSITKTNTRFLNDCREILFHPTYSSGTAAVRSDYCFPKNFHYYWEIKILSQLYGTDVMIGVGTSDVNLSKWSFEFRSMLGLDSYSWGYSYNGVIQHDKLTCRYGSPYGLGCIIGVHLDMFRGTLEYHLNGKPLGIAFSDLKQYELHPMVSSTAAQSFIKLVSSVSEEHTLQMLCLEQVSRSPTVYKQYKKIPGLWKYYEKKYFWIMPINEETEKKRLAEVEDSLMCPLDISCQPSKKMCFVNWFVSEMDEFSERKSPKKESPEREITEENLYDDLFPSTSDHLNLSNTEKELNDFS